MQLTVTKVRVHGLGTDATGAGAAGPRSAESTTIRPVEVNVHEDDIACEAPLDITVDGAHFATTMRTPGADLELIYGLLLAEGKIVTAADVARVQMVDECHAEVTLAPGPDRAGTDRAQATVDLPGANPPAATRTEVPLTREDEPKWPASLLVQMTTKLKAQQPGFHKTGALHGAGLFNHDGELLVVREDIGRHNAVDKAIGWGLLNGVLPQEAHNLGLVISSRASFELVRKAVAASLPVMVVVSAPTSMGVQAARDEGLTLCAFARPPTMTVYSGEERVEF